MISWLVVRNADHSASGAVSSTEKEMQFCTSKIQKTGSNYHQTKNM